MSGATPAPQTLLQMRSCLFLRCLNLHRHEMRIRFCPRASSFFTVEIAVNYDRVALSCIAARRTRGLAVDHSWPRIFGHTLPVTNLHFAAVRNLLWIYSAIAFVQPCLVQSRGLG